MERLQKVIANSGFTSRRKAEELITSGRVKVNDQVINVLGYKVNVRDEIKIDDVSLMTDNKVYYLLNKPRGVISTTSDDKKRKTVVDLIDTNLRIYPIGRLDYDTTGALILTNDGEFANLMMHPSNDIDKMYIAKINGKMDAYDLKKLKNGLKIEDYYTRPCKAKIKKYDKNTNTSIVEVIIHEGKNHQVKKMFEALGYEVLKLKRERIAFLNVDDLKSGEYRYLTPKEVKQLYNLAIHNE